MGKIKETRELYKEVIKEISKNEENWQSFLDSSSWNFKYDFDDQILIYAQRPDAKACATMEEWNRKLKRWINSGAKPIYIFDKDPYSNYPFKLVFDLSDTHNYNNTKYKLWSIKKEYEKDVIENLEASFGEIESKESLEKAITLASYNMVIDNIDDYLTSILNNKTNSILKDMSNEDIKNILIVTVWSSVCYMMMTRCGINAREKIQSQEFSYIKYFNNQEVLTILGASVSDIAEMGLREIAKTVTILQKNENFRNHTLEKIDKELYPISNKLLKGGNENERENRIHETGRILYAKSSNEEREDTSREVFTNEIQLSKESQEPRTNNSSNESEIDTASNRSARTSQTESTNISGTNGEERWSNRRNEDKRPNEMGGIDEQLQNNSRGNSSERTDLHLEEDISKRKTLTKEEMKSNKDFLKDKYTSTLLSNVQNLRVTRDEIKKFYELHPDIKERTDYIKKVFDNAYTEIVVNNTRLGYKTYENVLHLWKDNYLNRTEEVYYDWTTIAEYIEGLIMVNEFNDLYKPVQNLSEQMQILQVEAENAPTFSFSQEIIDYAIQLGGNTQDSKMRIYNQFEKSLSSEENIRFLKNEYGWGGCSSIHIGTQIGINYNSNGIKLNRGYGENIPEIILSWNRVEKRISELIKLDRYLNSKEKENYYDWLKKEEQKRELSESKERLSNIQNRTQEDELAEKIYLYVKPHELYNYPDDTGAINTDAENIEIIKADINDTRNIKDYIDALKKINENMENTNQEKKEIEKLINTLEKRNPNYEYHLGDTIYIGADQYEIAGITNNIVTLYDPKFPLFNKQMDFKEFERKVRENYANDYLKVEDKDEISINPKEKELEEKLYEFLNNYDIFDIDEVSIEQIKKDLKDLKSTQETIIYLKDIQKQENEESEFSNELRNIIKELEKHYEKLDKTQTKKENDLKLQEEVVPNFTRKKSKIQDFILHPEIATSNRINYKIKDNDLGIGTPREKFERNISAIKVLKRCEQENRYATPEEQEILSKYIGWGGLSQVFDEKNSNWSKEYAILKELLNEEEYQAARSSTLTAFYTPPIVINAMYDILQNMGLKDANILEPSCRCWKLFRNVT